MQKYCLIIMLAILTSCISGQKKAAIRKTGKEGEGVPAFNVLLANGGSFNTSQIPAGKASVLFYFSATCPYCRVQMRRIVEHMDELRDIDFTVFAIGSLNSIKEFCNRYNLDKYPNIKVGIDTGAVFTKHYKAQAVPFTAVYGRDGKLTRALIGSADVQQLKI